MFQISDLQLALLRVLWDVGEGTVADVHAALAGRDLAASTVATLLARMEKRGLVDHRTEGRRFVYRPCVSEEEVRTTALTTVRDGLFAGDVTALVSHLLDPKTVRPEDRDAVRALLRELRDEEETRDDH